MRNTYWWAALAALGTVCIFCASGDAQVVGKVGYYNPYSGRSGTASAAYNPYTGTSAASRSSYNPTTGNYNKAGAVYNPYTGNSAKGVASYNPYTGSGSYAYSRQVSGTVRVVR